MKARAGHAEPVEKNVLLQALKCVCRGVFAPARARQNPPGAQHILPGSQAWSA